MKPAPGPSLDPTFAVCGVCGGDHDCGLGYSPDGRRDILWTCKACVEVGAKVYGVPLIHRNRWGQESRDHAGTVAAEYLQSIGKFDFCDLSLDETRRFFDVFLKAFQDNLRKMAMDHEAPF